MFLSSHLRPGLRSYLSPPYKIPTILLSLSLFLTANMCATFIDTRKWLPASLLKSPTYQHDRWLAAGYTARFRLPVGAVLYLFAVTSRSVLGTGDSLFRYRTVEAWCISSCSNKISWLLEPSSFRTKGIFLGGSWGVKIQPLSRKNKIAFFFGNISICGEFLTKYRMIEKSTQTIPDTSSAFQK